MVKSLYECFQHWSEKGSVYIGSDTHFDDWDCKLMDPDWISPEEQVEIINKRVTKNDCLILLGDVGSLEYARRLHGYKVLIMGNHDETRSKFEGVFNEIYEGPLFISEKILLSHEPVYGLSWCFNIHGHDHDRNHTGDEGHLNVAANVYGYKLADLNKLIKQGTFSKVKDIHRAAIDLASEHPFVDKK